jgi:hypothetical protein
MSLSRDSRQERKLKAMRRAQYRLGEAIRRIDWEEDVLLPELEALKSGKSVLGLPAGAAFDIQIQGYADPDHSATPDANTDATDHARSEN